MRWLLVAFCLAPPALCFAARAVADVSFKEHVAPIFVQKCVACHGAEKPKGRYRVDTFEQLMKPGASESASITPGEPTKSEVYRLIESHDDEERMPQKDERLKAGQIESIRKWIEGGAKFDGEDARTPLAMLVNASARHPTPPEVYPRPVPVSALAFSPDGKELAAGGYHEVTIWEAESGKLLGRIANLPQQIQSLAYSPDGKMLAAAGGTPGTGGEVKLLDVEKRGGVRSLVRTADMVLAVAFSLDGARVAAGGSDNAIRVFDVTTGSQEVLIEQHADWVMALAYSDDGKYLASGSRDKTARVYDAKSGAMVHGYQGHPEPVFAVEFSEDGKRVYSAGRDKKVHVWKSTEGEKSEAQVAGAQEDVLRMERFGEWLVTASADRKVRQYKASDRELVRTLEGHADWVQGMAAHPATKRLATGAFDGEVIVWDLTDGEPIKKFIAAPGRTGD